MKNVTKRCQQIVFNYCKAALKLKTSNPVLDRKAFIMLYAKMLYELGALYKFPFNEKFLRNMTEAVPEFSDRFYIKDASDRVVDRKSYPFWRAVLMRNLAEYALRWLAAIPA